MGFALYKIMNDNQLTTKEDTMKKSIQLYVKDGRWVACFLDECCSPDAAMISLFGTHHLPTALSASVPFYAVQDKIATKHPNCRVVLS